MIKTETLEKLCEELHEYPPNWREIIARFKAHPKHDPEKEFHINQYMGYFGEIHMDLSLEEIAKANPQFGINFKSTLSEGSGSKTFRFHHDIAGRLYAISKTRKPNNQPYTSIQYDKVVIVDGMPVVFEIKIGTWIGGSVSKQRYYGVEHYRKRNIRDNLRMEVVRRRLLPIREFYRHDVGYIFIIPRDVYYNRVNADKNSIYGQFIENNGLVVPFYTDRHTFRGEVRQAVQDKGLKLKQ